MNEWMLSRTVQMRRPPSLTGDQDSGQSRVTAGDNQSHFRAITTSPARRQTVQRIESTLAGVKCRGQSWAQGPLGNGEESRALSRPWEGEAGKALQAWTSWSQISGQKPRPESPSPA